MTVEIVPTPMRDRWRMCSLGTMRTALLMVAMMMAACGGDPGGPISPCPTSTPTMCAAADAGSETDLVCTDLQTDNSHCGDCDTACSPTDMCVGGQCKCVPVAACPASATINGQTVVACGARPDYCGGTIKCQPCPSGFVCGAGPLLPKSEMYCLPSP